LRPLALEGEGLYHQAREHVRYPHQKPPLDRIMVTCLKALQLPFPPPHYFDNELLEKQRAIYLAMILLLL
jgi:hypothetical protein